MIDQSRLRELLDYDADTGRLTWRHARSRAAAGARAGHLNSKGYRRIEIDDRQYFAHRLVWLYVYGEWPVEQIDHRNGDRDDNRIVNLRAASQAENNGNSRRPKHNTSGFKGVGLQKTDRKWRARIKRAGRSIHLGTFDTPEEAHAAYVAAATELFGEFARAF